MGGALPKKKKGITDSLANWILDLFVIAMSWPLQSVTKHWRRIKQDAWSDDLTLRQRDR